MNGLWKTDTGQVVPFIEDGSGHPRLLTAIPADPSRRAMYAPFGAETPPMPESECVEFDDFADGSPLNPIRDQDGRGACMAFSSAWAFSQAFRRQYGRFPLLSEWWLYGHINGGRDAGATVESGFRALGDLEVGLIADGIVPYAEFRRSRFPREAYSAPRYVADLIYRADDEAEFRTAVQLRRPVAFGCAIDQSFSELDSEGVPTSTPWGGAGGHAMVAWGGMKRSKAAGRRGAWLYRVVNSWGPKWGVGGCCWMTFDHISRGWGLDAFVVSTVKPSPDRIDAIIPVI